jgi:hypothetical protein
MALEIFEDLGYDRNQVHLILNWTFPNKGISMIDIEKYLEREVSLVLPYAADEMHQGLNLGAPPTYTAPEEPIGMLFEDLSLALSKDEHRGKKPKEPTESWHRVAMRYRQRKSQKE